MVFVFKIDSLKLWQANMFLQTKSIPLDFSPVSPIENLYHQAMWFSRNLFSQFIQNGKTWIKLLISAVKLSRVEM